MTGRCENCCKDCPRRCVGCHGRGQNGDWRCKDWAEAQKRREAERAVRYQKREICGYIHESKERTCRYQQRKRK